jgi:dipeptidase E
MELVDVIDEEGRTIGVVTRQEMRQRRLLHRCSYVLLFNQAGELFVHLRTATKDVYPSHWDLAIGGVVSAGETFEQGVQRELLEEVGVHAEVTQLFPFHYSDENSSLQAIVYRAVHDGPFTLQAEEIVRGEFMPVSTIKERASREPFCPDSLAVLGKLQDLWPQAFKPLAANLNILLGSGGFRTPERVAFITSHMRDLWGSIEKILFVPYALKDHDGYIKTLQERGLDAGYEMDGIHRHADPRQAVVQAQAIYVGGGNSFRLLAALQHFGLIDVIRQRVQQGMPYLGISAGANVACPTIKTTNDMPITQPESLEALGLVPFQINPHYFTGKVMVRQGEAVVEHFSETRDDRIREFHEMNDTPVLGLWEGGAVRVTASQVRLLGTSARLFRRGRPAQDLVPGMELTSLPWIG